VLDGRSADDSVLSKAAKEAIALRQNWLGPEHYLLAVLAEPSVATEAMNDLGVTHDAVASRLAQMKTVNGRRIRYSQAKGITTNPRAHEVSGWANGFAVASGRSEPSPEDWLLAVIYEGGGIVGSVLSELGVSKTAVVNAMRSRGIRGPEFEPHEDRPWQGQQEIEVDKSDWQIVVDVFNERVPLSSTLRWGFNSRRDRPGKVQFVAEEGIDLEAIVAEARAREARRRQAAI
jgi:ATP-dependent Clp protease ATP-binding subunit ClpA